MNDIVIEETPIESYVIEETETENNANEVVAATQQYADERLFLETPIDSFTVTEGLLLIIVIILLVRLVFKLFDR